MIKSAKRALTSIVGNGDVYDEELNTAICSAENPLNSRPVTYVGADDKLFLCQLGGAFASDDVQDEAVNRRKRWQRIQ